MACPDKYPANIPDLGTQRWNIRIEGNDLCWRPTSKTPLWRSQDITSLELLWEFDSLGEDFIREKLLSFATKWGPLGICQHDKFYLHDADYGSGIEGEVTPLPIDGQFLDADGNRLEFRGPLDLWDKPFTRCSARRVALPGGEKWYAESQAAWKNLSAAVHAMLRLVDELRRKRQKPSERFIKTLLDIRLYGFGRARDHYQSLCALYDEKTETDFSVIQAWTLVFEVLNDWLRTPSIRLFGRFNYETKKPEPNQLIDDRLGAFLIIASELYFVIMNPGDSVMADCAGCRRPFLLVQKPPRGDRVFCPECRHLKMSTRLSKRDFRARNKKKEN